MNRISPATVTFGVMAMVLGLVAAYVVRQSMQKAPEVAKAPPPVVVEPPRPKITIARANIRANTRISLEDLMEVELPKGADPELTKGVFSSPFVAIGRITNRNIKAGLAMRDDYLLKIGESLPDLAERLPVGFRALTIDVENSRSGGKRLEDGDHVDLSMTVEGTHPDLGEVQTRTLLTNVLVIDALTDRPYQRGTRRADGLTLEGLTVAVSPADANKLIVAQKTGILTASLRSAKEEENMDAAETVSRRELLGLREIPVPKVAEVKPAKKYTIERYSGGSMRVIEFTGDRIRESREGPSGRQFEPEEAPAQPISAPAPTSNKSAAARRPAGPTPSGVVTPRTVSVDHVETNPADGTN